MLIINFMMMLMVTNVNNAEAIKTSFALLLFLSLLWLILSFDYHDNVTFYIRLLLIFIASTNDQNGTHCAFLVSTADFLPTEHNNM